jgi:hypothetical protein
MLFLGQKREKIVFGSFLEQVRGWFRERRNDDQRDKRRIRAIGVFGTPGGGYPIWAFGYGNNRSLRDSAVAPSTMLRVR